MFQSPFKINEMWDHRIFFRLIHIKLFSLRDFIESIDISLEDFSYNEKPFNLKNIDKYMIALLIAMSISII